MVPLVISSNRVGTIRELTTAMFDYSYTGDDPIGVELAGALKNVYAIAAGIAAGLGFENNTRASECITSHTKDVIPQGSIPPVLITRGLAEMTRIGTAYGASPLTFLSLAGVGDLFLTCSSSTSRNFTVGYRLGQGEKLEHIIKTIGSVAEGVTTAKGLKAIVDDLGVVAPIASGVSNMTPLSIRSSRMHMTEADV